MICGGDVGGQHRLVSAPAHSFLHPVRALRSILSCFIVKLTSRWASAPHERSANKALHPTAAVTVVDFMRDQRNAALNPHSSYVIRGKMKRSRPGCRALWQDNRREPSHAAGKPSLSSEVLNHPYIAIYSVAQKGQMVPVRRRAGPSYGTALLLPYGPGIAVEVDVKQGCACGRST